jgi:hypothetical protein
MQLNELTAETMRPLVGDRFTVGLGGGTTFELTLDDVVVVLEKHVSPRLKRDSFALYFSSPKDTLIKQGTYPVTHPVLGEMTIFLVPKRQLDHGGFEIEAIFT